MNHTPKDSDRCGHPIWTDSGQTRLPDCVNPVEWEVTLLAEGDSPAYMCCTLHVTDCLDMTTLNVVSPAGELVAAAEKWEVKE